LPPLLPAKPNPRFTRIFAWYSRRLLEKSFHAVRLARDTEPSLSAAAAHNGPLIILISHASWWDPLIGLFLTQRFTPAPPHGRASLAPMDLTQLKKMPFFRRIGIFGINPDDAASLPAMQHYIAEHFNSHPRPSLVLTPQGRFADPRATLTIRPGAAAIAAKHANVRVLSIAIEYAFHLDQKPEVFLRAQPVTLAPDRSPSTPHWHRAILAAMVDNAAQLASLVIARDPAPFTTLLGGKARAHSISDSHRLPPPTTPIPKSKP